MHYIQLNLVSDIIIPVQLPRLQMVNKFYEAIRWISETHRKQKVVINDIKSKFEKKYIVSIRTQFWDLCIFLKFINDLPFYTENLFTDLYADDTTIYQISNSQYFIEQNLQAALQILFLWCKHNGMSLNTDKTKVMLITTSEKHLHLNDCVLNLTYNSDILKNINNDKVLRVLIDNNLTWSIHMQSIAKKISHILWLLSKLKAFFSLENRECEQF